MITSASYTERDLATIVVVRRVLPIPDADKICLAEINGWQCVIKKNEFVEGDHAIYYSIDTVPDPADPNFDTVRQRGGRIKTIRLRGVLSQGMLSPLSWLSDRGHDTSELVEGEDVTDRMGLIKYISEEERDQYFPGGVGADSDDSRSGFPREVPKTDENRLQNNPKLLEYIAGRNIVITRKEDGCSGTFMWKDGVFHLCGRNFTYHEPTGTNRNYYLIAAKLNIESRMRDLGRNIAVQGEIVGPKVNGNRLRLEEYQFRVFNVYCLDSHRYILWADVVDICAALGLDTVPVIFRGNASQLNLTVSAFLDLANDQRYAKNVVGEGIVVKSDDDGIRTSFKVISNNYLLKHKL
ncbi:unnamed protein product [Ectocarpus fasciculatus]